MAKTFFETGHITSPLVDSDICVVSRSNYISGAPFNYFDMTDLKTYLENNLQLEFMKIVGTWDPVNNIPLLQSSIGTPNEVYVVSSNFVRALNNQSKWTIGDLLVFDGNVNEWRKIGVQDSSTDLIFFSGQYGITSDASFKYDLSNNSFAGGGFNNTLGASALYSGYVGGEQNSVTGNHSFIGAGLNCDATGETSYAFGRYANAIHDSSFVIQLDSAVSPFPFSSTQSDTFIIKSVNGIGLQTNAPNSAVTINGTFSTGRYAIITETANTSSLQSFNAFTVDFPNRVFTLLTLDKVVGRVYTIKDESGTAGTNFITINCEGAATIDGQTSIQITINYGFVTVYSDGTNWFTR
jgi:hypothetical protein